MEPDIPIVRIANAIRNFENPKIPEEEFKRIWLPLFAGLSGQIGRAHV